MVSFLSHGLSGWEHRLALSMTAMIDITLKHQREQLASWGGLIIANALLGWVRGG
jgi:hypothetical protein